MGQFVGCRYMGQVEEAVGISRADLKVARLAGSRSITECFWPASQRMMDGICDSEGCSGRDACGEGAAMRAAMGPS